MDKSHLNHIMSPKVDASFRESLKLVREAGGEFIHSKALRNPTDLLGEVPSSVAEDLLLDFNQPMHSGVDSVRESRRQQSSRIRLPDPQIKATSFSVDSNLTSTETNLDQLQGITKEATESHSFLPIESHESLVALSPTRSLRFSETQNHLNGDPPSKYCSIYSGCHTDSGLVPSIPIFHQDIQSDDNSI